MMETTQTSNPPAVTEVNTDQTPDLTMMPPIRKNLKPEVERKIIKGAVMGIFPDNPIGALHTLFEKECFQFEFSNNNQIHKVVLRIAGRVFEKISTQKRKARDGVAVEALQYLYADVIDDIRKRGAVFKENPSSVALFNSVNHISNVPAKTHKLPDNEQNNGPAKKIKQDRTVPTFVDPSLLKKDLKPEVTERLVKQALELVESDNPNTVTALHSLFEKEVFSFDVIELNRSDAKFKANLRIGDRIYTSKGISIKKAKSNATKKALYELFPEYASPSNLIDDLSKSVEEKLEVNDGDAVNGSCVLNNDSSISEDVCSENVSLSDFIANAVQSKYNNVVLNQPDHLRRYSILSGIVMIQNDDTSTACVISLSTGNKCLCGDKMSTKGDVLFDCHAEILSKRCLVRYIYSQLVMAVTTDHETILESGDRGLLRIKSNVKFYLFINSAPCGDGRVFSFSEPKNPASKKATVKRGILRVKLESGMGGIPVTQYSEMSTTYEGYLRGKPLVVMCCSAKLLRANVLGIQGALLSQIIEPVYLAGVLIGDVFNKDNVKRALYERVTISDSCLPLPYRLNVPLIEGISDSKIVINVKPGKSCMNWVVSDPIIEFINTKTGKTCDEKISRLSKLNLFKEFLNLLGLMKKIDLSIVPQLVYRNCKEGCQVYRKVRKMLFEDLEKNSRGKWVIKPKELNDFSLPISSCEEN